LAAKRLTQPFGGAPQPRCLRGHLIQICRRSQPNQVLRHALSRLGNLEDQFRSEYEGFLKVRRQATELQRLAG